MPRLACPHCRKQFGVSEEERGQAVACPECGKRIKVPAAKGKPVSPPASPPRADVGEKDVASPEPSRSRARPADTEDSEDEGKAPGKRPNIVVRVFGGIAALLVVAAIILVLSGKWVDLIAKPFQKFLEDQGIHPVLAIAVTGAILLVPLGLWLLSSTKSTILDAMPVDLEFVPARLEDFPNLDQKKLTAYSDSFEKLGFRPLMDYTVQTESEGSARGFARLFVDPGKHCYAEVNQAFAAGSARPMRASIFSLLEDGWSLASGDREPSKEYYLLRRPRGVWHSFPGEKPSQLVAAHLKLREEMIGDLDVSVRTEDTAEAYFENEKKATRERKERVRRRWALGILLEFKFFEKNPKYQWLGEFARKRKQ
jgi:DNA-directed RNA polymerase subunit RPC12/RpoP